MCRKPPSRPPERLHRAAFPPAGTERPCGPMSLQRLVLSVGGISAVLLGMCWDRTVVFTNCVSLRTCDVQPPPHVLAWPMCVFSGQVSVHLFCLFVDWVSLLLCFKSSFYVLPPRPLSDVCFANVFSQPVACLFHGLTGIFRRAEVFNFNGVQFISYFCHGSSVSLMSEGRTRHHTQGHLDFCPLL